MSPTTRFTCSQTAGSGMTAPLCAFGAHPDGPRRPRASAVLAHLSSPSLRRTSAAVALLALVTAFAAAGCSGDDDDPATTAAPSTVHELRAPEGTDANRLEATAELVQERA